MYKLLETFGGIGAARNALERISPGVKCIDYVEIQATRVRAYNALYDHLHRQQSVVGWNLKPDILVHGSPCQDLSRVGLRKGANAGSDTRSSLMHETLKTIKEMGDWRPSVVVWENVKGVLDKDLIAPFHEYLDGMEALGYSNSYAVLDARDFGIPHARERVFCVSLHGKEAFDFSTLRKKEMRPLSAFLEFSPADYAKVPQEYLITIPSMLSKISEFNPNPTGSYKRQLDVITDYCYTITERQDRCPNAGIIRMDNGQYRYLTERECWRLLGFSDDEYALMSAVFPKKPGKRSATLYALAGNSIVVDVLEAIFNALIEQGHIVESSAI